MKEQLEHRVQVVYKCNREASGKRQDGDEPDEDGEEG